jgi:cyclopropane fatty-acyl-phospholipid synthase-like methyltransferase
VAFALRKGNSDGSVKDAVPIKERFRAWWNGYELPKNPSSQGDPPPVMESEEPAADETLAEEPESAPAAQNQNGEWSEARRDLAEAVWSPGFVTPGGSKYVEKLVSGCSLTAAETMLEIGIGMGGATRTIIGKFGNYVTAYERDKDLAEAAREHAVTYDFDDKLEVINAPVEDLDLKLGYFRAALLRDVVFTIEDKKALLTQVSQSLKNGDSYLIATDFLFKAKDESPELAAWKEAEGRPVYPWTEAQFMKCLESVGITPRIVEDESEDYRAMVVEAWAEYLKSIKGKEVSEEMGREMAREGEYWARRVAALESGALKYYRIEAVKIS